jgi:DtxR family Mn-dependent transcriptional regulator
MSAARLGRAREDYLKAIFKLQERFQHKVPTNKLAEELKVSPAAVTKAVKHLSKDGLANYKPYSGVSLTEEGRSSALEIIRHHRLLELFLHDILGYSWDEVDEEAERLEHHISEKFEASIDRLLNYPKIDPHGDPIPSLDGKVASRHGKSLADCEESEVVVVVRVSDSNSEALQYLDRLAMHPDAVVEIVEKQPFDGPLTLRINSSDHVVGRELASYVSVRPVASVESLESLQN